MTNSQHFFYLRKRDGRPIGVLALRRKDKTTVRLAASLCSPHDTWDRTAGVNKACGKLNSDRYAMDVDFVTAEADDGPDVRPNLAADVIAELLMPMTQTRRCDVMDTLNQLDIDRAQTMLARQITYMLTPKPEAAP